jgi:hypothetical protein
MSRAAGVANQGKGGMSPNKEVLGMCKMQWSRTGNILHTSAMYYNAAHLNDTCPQNSQASK